MRFTGLLALFLISLPGVATNVSAVDLILHNAKIVTVDDHFAIEEATAIRGERIVQVGSSQDVLKSKTPETKVIDLEGRTVLPGLMDSHVHPGAAMHEFDHVVPEIETIAQLLDYIRARARAIVEGDWIHLRQIFITRLKEQRYPTRAELDTAAPKHPVNFATGPDSMLNSLALELSGIDKDFEVTDGGPGQLERDPDSGEPTGLLRGLGRFIKMKNSGRTATERDHHEQLVKLFRDYNANGITAVSDRGANAGAIARYQKISDQGDLTVRLALCHTLSTLGDMESIFETIDGIAKHPLRAPDPMLRIVGTKIWLDGGMLTGSAYMREPWGVSEIYGITDPEYRGVLNVPPERLLPMVRKVVDAGMQFNAHAVGDGAVHALLDAYEEVNRTQPVRETRPCIAHSNFMSREAVELGARLGVVNDIQPAWLYLDTRTLQNQFGYERLRYFQSLRSIFEAGGIAGGGSDHMQKIGSLRAVNPYNPFLGMWIAITRQAKCYDGQLHPEEALSREQAIRFYTHNNAYLMFWEKETGSLESGKRADLIVLGREILTCPVDEILDIQVLSTYLDGKLVFSRE